MNLLHHKIGIHILYSHLYTFPLVPTRRIRLTIKASWDGYHFLSFLDLNE